MHLKGSVEFVCTEQLPINIVIFQYKMRRRGNGMHNLRGLGKLEKVQQWEDK
jgi:hypothetical protein